MYQPAWITFPAGPFRMGSDPRHAAPPYPNEFPQQRLTIPTYYISRVPITNAQYHRFIAATHHPAPSHWRDGAPPAHQANHPVTYVTWHDATAFCTWANVRLPTEAEWEKAARGPATTPIPTPNETRWWPWGNDLPDATRAHFDGQSHGIPPAAQGVMPVGHFPHGASPYGVLDLAGNVWEWTASPYRAYPFRPEFASHAANTQSANRQQVVRGGSYNHDARHIRCSARDGMASGVRDVYIGFRVASDPTETPRPDLDLEWVTIEAGPFWLGSTKMPPARAVMPSEFPQHTVELRAFRLAQTPVTNADYRHFIRATNHPAPAHWYTGDIPHGLANHPVTHVDWHDAQAFCAWANVRLPTEAEWERAAAGGAEGTPPHIYPWGDTAPTAQRLNFRHHSKAATTTPVDRYARGATPEGILDLAGNVWEWCHSAYAPYPYSATDGREATDPYAARVLRGGSFLSPSAAFVRSAMRSLSYPTRRREHIGFRVAQDLPT